MRCTYLRCDQPPVKRVQAVGDRIWWYGCTEHIGAMIDAMYVGVASDRKVTVEAV